MTAAYKIPEDIANRALQHCGARRITTFQDSSKNASETSFCYDKLRRAELQRNTWRFATRRAAIWPIETTTMFLRPALWSAAATYYVGSIVADADGTLWISNSPDNLGNSPGFDNAGDLADVRGGSQYWDRYFGPLTVQPFDTTGQTAYFAGDLVYEAPQGDGAYAVYLSLQDGNSQDPGIAMQWQPGTFYSKDQIVQFAPNWASGTTYAAGASVNYNGVVYVSLAASNTGNEPDISPTWWVTAPTTLGPALWSDTTTYSIGQFATWEHVTYVSLQNSNLGNNPDPSAEWAAVAAPALYLSKIDFNMGNEPDLSPAPWVMGATYASGATVAGSDGYIYTSKINGNVSLNPVGDNGVHWTNTGTKAPWTTQFVGGTGSDQWLYLPVSLSDMSFTYPVGTGPTDQTQTRNVYRLPAGYLNMPSSQDPKEGSVSFLGAPTGNMYKDWLLEGDYLITRDSYPIVLRFVADMTDVTKMHDMFCEGLAARIAAEVCETVTQSTQKLAAISAAYKTAMSEARLVNAIETGPVEPPEDDYVTCRL